MRSTKNASPAGSKRSTLTTAPISKFCCPITCLYTSVASTLYWPPMTFGAPKSVITITKTTKVALISP